MAPSYGKGKTKQTSICTLPVLTNDWLTCVRAIWSDKRQLTVNSLILYVLAG